MFWQWHTDVLYLLKKKNSSSETENKQWGIQHVCINIYIYSATLTWTVWSVWRVGWLPDAVVGTEVAVDSILSEAIAVFTVESTVDSFLLFRTDELSIHWDVRLVTRCPWADTHNALPWFSQVGAQCLITIMHDCTMKLKNSGTAKGHWHWCFVLFTVYFIFNTQYKKKRERVPWGAGTSLRCRGALIPWTVTVRLHVRLFPAASVAVYCTTVSPTGNREPGLWRLVTVRRPPERQTDDYFISADPSWWSCCEKA